MGPGRSAGFVPAYPCGSFPTGRLELVQQWRPTITASATGGAGQTIVFIDYAQEVSVETATTGTIKIHYAHSTAQSGSVSLMW
jgi:hypothetical protein